MIVSMCVVCTSNHLFSLFPLYRTTFFARILIRSSYSINSIYYYISFILGFITRRDIVQMPFLSIPNLFPIVFRFYRDLFVNIQRKISGAYSKLDNSIPCETLSWPKEILHWMIRLMSFIASLSFFISMQLSFLFWMLTH
jgi:hypothetical protein